MSLTEILLAGLIVTFPGRKCAQAAPRTGALCAPVRSLQAVSRSETDSAASPAAGPLTYETDYFRIEVAPGDGIVSLYNKSDGSPILSPSPRFELSYGEPESHPLELPDSSFELTKVGSTPSGWIFSPPSNDATSTWGVSSDYAHEGAKSLKLTALPAAQLRLACSPPVRVRQDAKYQISIDSRYSSYTSGNVSMYIYWYPTIDGTGRATLAYVYPDTTAPTDTQSWHANVVTWRPPPDAGSFRFVIAGTNTLRATVFLDRLTVHEIIYPQYPLSGGTPEISTRGDDISIASSNDSGADARISQRFELNLHSPLVKYEATFTYKRASTVLEERLDFPVPSLSALVMTRDLELRPFDTSKTYYSDLFTPKIVKFANGLSLSGGGTFQSMRLRAVDGISQLSLYADLADNHPFANFVKNGDRARTDRSAQTRAAGDTYTVSATFGVSPGQDIGSLAKTRQPYGYDATLVLTNHPDAETPAAVNAVAYGSEDASDPGYGTRGIVGRRIGWTKGVFVWGQAGADLQDPRFKTLTGRMFADGVEIVGHSISPSTDSRSDVARGLETLAQYRATNWIDHGAKFGDGNWEALSSQGAIKTDPNYILDLLASYGYGYAWSFWDLAARKARDPNILDPSTTGANTSYFYYNNNVDDRPGRDRKIYLWCAQGTGQVPDLYYTPENIDGLIAQRGVHISHEYMGLAAAQNHTWCKSSSGTVEICPTFDDELNYIASKRQSGELWSPTVTVMGDYLVALQDVLVSNNPDGSFTVTNNGANSITGLTLLAEQPVRSAVADGKIVARVNSEAAAHDRQIVLPRLDARQSTIVRVAYGTADATAPAARCDDPAGDKINDVAGTYDPANGVFRLVAEGEGVHRFTVTVPGFAGVPVLVLDTTAGTTVGNFQADAVGNIAFSARLSSVREFEIRQTPLPRHRPSRRGSCSRSPARHLLGVTGCRP